MSHFLTSHWSRGHINMFHKSAVNKQNLKRIFCYKFTWTNIQLLYSLRLIPYQLLHKLALRYKQGCQAGIKKLSYQTDLLLFNTNIGLVYKATVQQRNIFCNKWVIRKFYNWICYFCNHFHTIGNFVKKNNSGNCPTLQVTHLKTVSYWEKKIVWNNRFLGNILREDSEVTKGCGVFVGTFETSNPWRGPFLVVVWALFHL